MSRIVHVEILSKAPERLSRFYEEALGWKIRPAFEPPPGADRPGIEYWLAETGDPKDVGINGAFMGRQFDQAVIHTVGVESLQEATERIERAGGRLVHGPNHIPGVGDHAYFADPEGTLFGVIQPVPME